MLLKDFCDDWIWAKMILFLYQHQHGQKSESDGLIPNKNFMILFQIDSLACHSALFKFLVLGESIIYNLKKNIHSAQRNYIWIMHFFLKLLIILAYSLGNQLHPNDSFWAGTPAFKDLVLVFVLFLLLPLPFPNMLIPFSL